MNTIRDILLVARFEIFRAYRTRTAMSLLVLYGLGMSVAVWVFSKILYGIENILAETLQVPMKERPGSLLQKVYEQEDFATFVSSLPNGADLLTVIQTTPVLAVVILWIGLGIAPFFAAATSAESISMDRTGRALRYELVRTGRFEFVLGRYVGRAVLTLLATLAGGMAAAGIGLHLLDVPDPHLQLAFVAVFSLKTWAYSLAYVGIGLGFSQVTVSPAWARVLALAATVGIWIGYGLVSAMVALDICADFCGAILPLFPPYWASSFWGSAGDVAIASLVSLALSLGALLAGFVWFRRVDL
jgi:ABC-type transport system involved in multi-copper enzyme maturation permease subunit